MGPGGGRGRWGALGRGLGKCGEGKRPGDPSGVLMGPLLGGSWEGLSRWTWVLWGRPQASDETLRVFLLHRVPLGSEGPPGSQEPLGKRYVCVWGWVGWSLQAQLCSLLSSSPSCLPQTHWAAPALPRASLSRGLTWGTHVSPLGRYLCACLRGMTGHTWHGVKFPRGVSLALVGDLRPVSRHEVRWRCGRGPSGLCDPQQCHLPPTLLTLSLSPLLTAGRQRRKGPRGVPRPHGRPCK